MEAEEPEAAMARVVNYLLMQESTIDGVLSKKLAKQVLINCDKALFQQFQKALQECLDKIDIDAMDRQKELFIANVIALIPYAYPDLGHSFQLPIKNSDGIYQRHRFSVEQIIPMSISSAITPLNAYALQSDEGKNLLLFTGTTFPAGGGFLNSLIADFTAFSSVGKLPFGMGKEALDAYFASHENVSLYGMSLGGALCLHSFRIYEHKIKDVHAVVPAGLHMWDRFNNHSEKKVVIITQQGDIVSQLGFFPEHGNVELYHLKSSQSQTKGVLAHARAFSGSSGLSIEVKDVKKENRSFFRRIVTIMHIALGWLVFLALMPILSYYQLKKMSIMACNQITCLISKKSSILQLPL